jgi:hypothetical protein
MLHGIPCHLVFFCGKKLTTFSTFALKIKNKNNLFSFESKFQNLLASATTTAPSSAPTVASLLSSRADARQTILFA